MRTVTVDCADVQSTDEFWQRYLDAAQPDGAPIFGRNLDAFWDAIERGGPGWPGHVSLIFTNSRDLSPLMSVAGTMPFLAALQEIAAEATAISIRFE